MPMYVERKDINSVRYRITGTEMIFEDYRIDSRIIIILSELWYNAIESVAGTTTITYYSSNEYAYAFGRTGYAVTGVETYR